MIPVPRRIVPRLKRTFRGVRLRVRLDGGFAAPRILAVLEELKVQYVVALPGNNALEREVADRLDHQVKMAELVGESQRSFDTFAYRARSWSHSRGVRAKVGALVHDRRSVKRNPRFVVTSLFH